MLGASCTFDREQHVIMHHDIIDWARRQALPKDRASLFLYFHRQEHTWVIGKWVGTGKFVDVLNLGTTCHLERDDAYWFAEQMSVTYKGIDRDKIQQRYNDEQSCMQNENDEELEYRRKRHGDNYE